ncbi:hypothetical protein GGI07_001326 [Coemansia sp. Benny D115]|nr:hypothetical protein GGI07_001326 [Coemansia sp. Benny D115]
MFHSGAHVHAGLPPVRDGDELSQPLEPGDKQAFWDNLHANARKDGGSGSGRGKLASRDSEQEIGKLCQLTAEIVDKKAHKGTVSLSYRTQQFSAIYEQLDMSARWEFLKRLAHDFCATKGAAAEAAERYLKGLQESSDPATSAPQARALRDALTAQYAELFDQINRLPGGFAFLVHMRGDMLACMRQATVRDPAMRAMSDVLQRKFETWIIGTLDLKRITWNSPAYTIEKLGQYESVHAVRSWLDVKRRLGNGRRCFGFFHRSVPMEPLVFVWVALGSQISSSVQSILDEREPSPPAAEDAAQCAVFYSINSQPGLSGVDLGNFLIKRVVGVLRAELPSIREFCTLSPIPGFRTWLDKWLSSDCLATPPVIGLAAEEQQQLQARVPEAQTWTQALKALVDSRGWTSDQANLDAMEPVLRLLAAHYLMHSKRGSGHFAMDPVANFHLRNGACLHRINWRGDTSYRGLRQSLGLMVNYNYVLDSIEQNNERYVADGTIAISGSDPFILRARQAAQPNAKL